MSHLFKRKDDLKNINYGILKLSDTIMIKTLLFGDSVLNDSIIDYVNSNSITDCVIATKIFDDPIVTLL